MRSSATLSQASAHSQQTGVLEEHDERAFPPSAVATLDLDQFQRYSLTAQLLERMLGTVQGTSRVLEVGPNVLNLLPGFLDSRRFHVTRCDIDPFADDPDFVLLERDRPLPFGEQSFDAVVALDVLEHIPRENRFAFLGECLRVARHGAVFTCPNGVPEVTAAEALVDAAFRHRQGRPHPFLEEHRRFGLPSETEVLTLLRELDVPHAVFDNAPLDVWLTIRLLSENLSERGAADDLKQRLNQPFFRGLLAGRAMPYRKVYVCAKTFDATAALEPIADTSLPGADLRALPLSVAPLQHLTTVVCEALSEMEKDHRAEVAELEARLVESQDETAAVQTELAVRDADLRSWREQHVALTSLFTSVTRSWTWRLLEPVRALRRLLRPRGFTAAALIPWHELEKAPGEAPGEWIADGFDPQFIVPCLLPAGWVRLRMKMSSPIRGRLELFVDTGHGFNASECIKRAEVRGGVELDFFVYFSRPVRAVRFDPIDAEGPFYLERLRVEPVPGPHFVLHALRAKLSQIRARGMTLRGLGKGVGLLLTGRLGAFVEKTLKPIQRATATGNEEYDENAEYLAWRQRRQLTDDNHQQMRRAIEAMTAPPLISVLMPVYNMKEKYLRLALESVRRQIYPHWELCVADDGSSAPHVRTVLEEYARRDARIKVAFREENGGIAAASNSALALATGDYVALLDHDDEYAEHALFRVAQTIVADRSLDMLYSDEDKIDLDGRHVEPFFKPDWSPEYFLACMYTCHLGVYRTGLVRELGGFRADFDTAQDYDLVLRLTARTSRIHHIPDVLYHWRKLPTSTASGSIAKPQAENVARRALRDFLAATGRKGTVHPGPVPGFHRIRYDIAGRPLISIIIPSACRPVKLHGEDTYYVQKCVESIRRKSTHDHYEIVVMHSRFIPGELERELTRLGVTRLEYAEPFNWSAAMNQGAAAARGDQLLFLNDDMEVITPDWLECMLEFAQQPEVGAVGAKLLFPDGRIQHVGVTVLDGHPGHPFYLGSGQGRGYYCGNVVHRNYSAVTGACLMTRAELFRALDGFAVDFPLNYNDVDYCLRVVTGGKRIVYTPYAQLYHHESVTKKGTYEHELEAFKKRWKERWPCDPYYNPNLSMYYTDYRIEADYPPVAADASGEPARPAWGSVLAMPKGKVD